jgi:hypothetical protein
MRNIYRIPTANRGLSIKWSSYSRFAPPPSGGFRFRSVFTTSESAINLRTAAAGREMSTDTISKPESAYPMVQSLPLGGAIYLSFPFPVRSCDL